MFTFTAYFFHGNLNSRYLSSLPIGHILRQHPFHMSHVQSGQLLSAEQVLNPMIATANGNYIAISAFLVTSVI